MSCLGTFYLWVCVFVFICRAIVLTHQEHLGVTYITLNEDPCPRMVIHNKCPIPLLLKENVKGRKGTGKDADCPVSLQQAFWACYISLPLFSSYLSQKPQGLKYIAVLCLLTALCTMSSTTTSPVSPSAGRKRYCLHCCWKPHQTTAPPTGLSP